jgi:hypothetical protein
VIDAAAPIREPMPQLSPCRQRRTPRNVRRSPAL